jgi:hypothetical protein
VTWCGWKRCAPSSTIHTDALNLTCGSKIQRQSQRRRDRHPLRTMHAVQKHGSHCTVWCSSAMHNPVGDVYGASQDNVWPAPTAHGKQHSNLPHCRHGTHGVAGSQTPHQGIAVFCDLISRTTSTTSQRSQRSTGGLHAPHSGATNTVSRYVRGAPADVPSPNTVQLPTDSTCLQLCLRTTAFHTHPSSQR